jgi:hypothetical protein
MVSTKPPKGWIDKKPTPLAHWEGSPEKGILRIFPVPGVLLDNLLQQAICLRENRGDQIFDEVFTVLEPPLEMADKGIFQLKKVGKKTQLIYSTGFALKLASQFSADRHHIGTQILTAISTVRPSSSGEMPLQKEFWSLLRVSLSAAGLIQLEPEDRAIALWLDFLCRHPPLIQFPDALTFSAGNGDIFHLQATHARCCSLLQLAQREGVIVLAQPEKNPLTWQLTQPQSLPWLAANQELRLQDGSDRRLIVQLVDAVDYLSSTIPTGQAVYQSCQAICQELQQFLRRFPLLGERGATPLVHSRLGLILATQRILHLLLEDVLDIEAPIEL